MGASEGCRREGWRRFYGAIVRLGDDRFRLEQTKDVFTYAQRHEVLGRYYTNDDLRDARKLVARWHYLDRTNGKPWDEGLDPDIRAWAESVFTELMKGLSCVDGFRLGIGGKSSSMRRYQRIKSHGCCGFVDEKMTGPDGRHYFFGFCHGH